MNDSTYAYDAAGNRTNMTTLEGLHSFAYDNRNQLVGAVYPDGSSETFTYDLVGNRTALLTVSTNGSLSTTHYIYGSGNRLLMDEGPSSTNLYAYDGAGRLTNHVVNGQTRTFSYNFQGRMTSLTDIDGSVFAYEFDGEGNRLSQSLNDCLSKRFVYDGADVLLELNPTNGVAYAWVNGPGIDQPIERLLFIDGDPRTRRVFHAAALGSIAALTDPSGLVTQSYAYAAFGSLRSSSGHDPNRVTYTGREQVGDSQVLVFYRNRDYLPIIGRFSSIDPLGFVDGGNLWLYSRNNPLIYRDPFGLRIQVVKPEYRADVLSVMKQFVYGNLSFDENGFLHRDANADTRRGDIECFMDSLIASENVYQIVPEKPDFVDGAFIPYSQQAGDLNWWRSMGHGGTIYFSLTPDFYYPSGFYPPQGVHLRRSWRMN